MADAGTLTLDPPPATAFEAPPAPRAAPSSRGSRVVLAAAALIIAGGAALRFGALHTSIWFDESVTVRDVSGSFGQMLHKVVNHEASPPFYFICLWIWRHLVGSTAFDLRLLSWVVGTATIALAFYVARPRIGDRGALILTACVAVSPALVYYSAEMRMYGLLILVSGIGFAAFLRASDSPGAMSLSVWAVASILAIGTQYYAAVAVAPQAALLIAQGWRLRPRPQSTLLAVASVTLAGLPLLYLMVYEAHRAWAYGIPLVSSAWDRVALSIHAPGISFASLLEDVVVGPGGPARGWLTLVAVAVVGTAFALLLRSRRVGRTQIIRAVCLIAPTLLAIEIVVFLQLLVEGRYMLPMWLPVGLAASYALASTTVGWVGLGLAGALIALWLAVTVLSLTAPRFGPQDDTLGAARNLGVASAARLIAINEPWDVLPLKEYRPEASSDSAPVVRVKELDVIAMPLGGEPSPADRARPRSLGVGVLPKGLRLTKIVRGSTYLLERFVAATPVAVRVHGPGSAFTAKYWRFLVEPPGAHLGSL